MGKLYDNMYQTFLKTSENWDDEAAYALYAAAVKKYLGATKFADGVERGKITVELARRKINEQGLDVLPEPVDTGAVVGEYLPQEVRMEYVGPGSSSDANGPGDVSENDRRTENLGEPEGSRGAVANARIPGRRKRSTKPKDQSLGIETVRDPLQGCTGQDRSTELSGDSVHRSGLQAGNGNDSKSGGSNSNPKNKRTRRTHKETRE